MPFQIIKGVSHCDHISDNLVLFIAARFEGRTGFFIETFELPLALAWENNLHDSLHGPLHNDDPVEEKYVWYAPRNDRKYNSRLVDDAPRATSRITVIAGPHEGYDCVMYTAFGGLPTPKEVNDPSLTDSERAESVAFWSKHAISKMNMYRCLSCGKTFEKYANERFPRDTELCSHEWEIARKTV